jgi:hypothetical protein
MANRLLVGINSISFSQKSQEVLKYISIAVKDLAKDSAPIIGAEKSFDSASPYPTWAFGRQMRGCRPCRRANDPAPPTALSWGYPKLKKVCLFMYRAVYACLTLPYSAGMSILPEKLTWTNPSKYVGIAISQKSQQLQMAEFQ